MIGQNTISPESDISYSTWNNAAYMQLCSYTTPPHSPIFKIIKVNHTYSALHDKSPNMPPFNTHVEGGSIKKHPTQGK